jgi:hypothetical protein
VIGGLAAAVGISYGGKKGYDRLRTSRAAANTVEDNPFYQPGLTERNNPLFESADL